MTTHLTIKILITLIIKYIKFYLNLN